MKPVLETVIDKNGAESQRFSPTGRMILFAISRAKNPTFTDNECAADVGVMPATVSGWKSKYGSFFGSWLEEMIDQHMPDKEAEMLHAVGMVEAMQGNFNFWKEMARTKGVIKEESKPLHITINTDFSHVAIGDFDEQRARLLSELRGVGQSGKSRVALPLTVEHAGGGAGAGDRAGPVQEGSLALANSLGTDRGQPRTRKSVPAFSK